MESVKKFLATKAYGFYVTIGAALLTILTAIVYGASYADTPRFISTPAIVVMIVGGIIALAVACTKFNELAPLFSGVATIAGLGLFMVVIYGYLIVLGAGIDLTTGIEARFVASCVLFVLSLIANLVAVFAKKVKE